MNDQPPPIPQKSKSKAILGVLTAVVCGVVAFLLAGQFGQKATSLLGNRLPPADWEKRALLDVTLEAPFAYGTGPDVAGEIPKEVQGTMESYEIKQGGDASGNLISTVARFAYKPGIPVSLDGAAEGMVQGANGRIAAQGGDTNLKYNIEKMTIGDLPARRANFSTTVDGTPFHFEALLVQSGQRLWQVQVIYTGDSRKETAKRILDSVQITAK